VGDDHDRVLLAQLVHQLLDGQRRDRVERRARFVHQEDLGLDGDGPGDAQPLLLPAGQARAGPAEPVLDLFPEVGAPQRPLDEVVGLGLPQPLAVELLAGEHVVRDRHRRERVRALEHHADLAAHGDGIDPRSVQVDAVDEDRALDVGAGDDLVHAVQRPQERRLPAAGRADQGGHRARLDDHVDVLHGEEVAVVDVEVLDDDAVGDVLDRGRRGRLERADLRRQRGRVAVGIGGVVGHRGKRLRVRGCT
jgi:hypothetical protein